MRDTIEVAGCRCIVMSMPKSKTMSLPPERLAAYQLGSQTRTLRMWQALFLRYPEWDTADGAPLTLETIACALVSIAAHIPTNLYSELRTRLRKETRRGTNVQFKASSVLTQLADRAAQHLDHLRVWYQAGATVGDYILTISESPVRVRPDAAPVVGALQACGLLAVPVTPARTKPAALLRQLVMSQSKKRGEQRSLVAKKLAEAGDPIDLALAVDTWIQQVLSVDTPSLRLNPQPTEQARPTVTEPSQQPTIVVASSRALPKPKWDAERGWLQYGETIVRRVNPKAANVRRLLDAFQEEDWPFKIYDPLPRDDPQRRHDTIRILNRGLRGIRFRGAGDNEQILWEPR